MRRPDPAEGTPMPDLHPTYAALHEALEQLVGSHPDSRGEPAWVLRLESAPPLAAGHELVSETPGLPAIVTVSVGPDTTRVDIAHPVEDDVPPPLTVPLTEAVAERLVPVLRSLVANGIHAFVPGGECVHCDGRGLALPLWRRR